MAAFSQLARGWGLTEESHPQEQQAWTAVAHPYSHGTWTPASALRGPDRGKAAHSPLGSTWG